MHLSCRSTQHLWHSAYHYQLLINLMNLKQMHCSEFQMKSEITYNLYMTLEFFFSLLVFYPKLWKDVQKLIFFNQYVKINS